MRGGSCCADRENEGLCERLAAAGGGGGGAPRHPRADPSKFDQRMLSSRGREQRCVAAAARLFIITVLSLLSPAALHGSAVQQPQLSAGWSCGGFSALPPKPGCGWTLGLRGGARKNNKYVPAAPFPPPGNHACRNQRGGALLPGWGNRDAPSDLAGAEQEAMGGEPPVQCAALQHGGADSENPEGGPHVPPQRVRRPAS